MLVLFETPAGFALFKVLDEGKLSKVEDLSKEFTTSDSARKVVKLKAFSKFENTSEALSAATLLIDSKPSKGLRKFLKAHCDGETLGIADSKLGNAIKEKLQIECVHNNVVMELMRGLRSQLTELISGLATQDLAPMSLGLSHSLSRYKLKFSPDKVDTMIVQAIGLLDDLDKELNTYAMRVREWYGWHFPELAKIVQDNILYAKAVKLMGDRVNAAKLDFSEILPEEVEAELKEAAMISMGTEVSDLDLENIKDLCSQVLSFSEYRAQLYDYLKSRMNTIAPNLTALVGELVGARLIAHGGSLTNLAKQPGSTVQILGAEKALFRALKTKHATPKYGLIYHASLIGQAAPKHKGKIARSLASKASLAIRYDALGDGQDNTMGLENRVKLEARLRALEGKELGKSAGSAKGKPKIEAYDKDRKKGAGALITPAKVYNPSADAVLGCIDNEEQKMSVEETGTKKEKKKKKHAATEENVEVEKSKKKKRKHSDDDDESETADKKKEKKQKKKKTEE
ncbi:probable nucleolar protein 5-2 [Solanum lycopersicum]|uniref:probable nucleolar protein 5-2 n=1 Tax=Solanum lycopersicum TaxID=4081 RepID=UPI0002767442|nr:probable nucleolar protein 5-2 [Solanum lycopersicum]XP_010321330.1 probable nucleolar protein 5-2 [Solanum lycopersicum]XP_019069428.1 probable nucleolar protein 5-2 [Solanum lycopersicum]